MQFRGTKFALETDQLYTVAKFSAKLNIAQNTLFEELNDFIDTLPDEVQDYIINSMIATDEISHQLSLIAVLHSPRRLKKVSQCLDLEVAQKELDIMITDGLGNQDHFEYMWGDGSFSILWVMGKTSLNRCFIKVLKWFEKFSPLARNDLKA